MTRPQTVSLTIPLPDTPWATLTLPHPMTEDEWALMHRVLEQMKPGIVAQLCVRCRHATADAELLCQACRDLGYDAAGTVATQARGKALLEVRDGGHGTETD